MVVATSLSFYLLINFLFFLCPYRHSLFSFMLFTLFSSNITFISVFLRLLFSSSNYCGSIIFLIIVLLNTFNISLSLLVRHIVSCVYNYWFSILSILSFYLSSYSSLCPCIYSMLRSLLCLNFISTFLWSLLFVIASRYLMFCAVSNFFFFFGFSNRLLGLIADI